jgi:hypothetical protein
MMFADKEWYYLIRNDGVGGSNCESAWNKNPVFGVIGIQSGPRG